MKEKHIVSISSTGLMIGCILGMAGSFVSSAAVRSVLWGTGSAGIIVAAALLTMSFFRKGFDTVAAGFFILAIGESVVFSSCATNIDNNIPGFAAGSFLWALSLGILSTQKLFPLFVRVTASIGATLFVTSAIQIFVGQPGNALSKPLPYFAYPFYAATLAGWAFTLLKKMRAVKSSI